VSEAGGAVDPTQLSTTKKAAFTLIVIVVPLAALAVAGELVLRWSEPPLPESTGTVVRRTGESEKQYELLPNSSGVVAGAAVSINSFGCRDREYPLVKPAGVVRIVGIGDSLTFGQGVSEPDTYLARLEKDVAAKQAVEVINCGVFGYNVKEEARRFEEVAEMLEPDIVVIGYELGDILQNPPLKSNGPGVVGEQGGTNGLVEWRSFIEGLKTSRLVTFLAYRYSFLLKRFNLRDWDALYADDSPLWKKLTAKYEAMATTAAARKIAVIVAIIPELSNLDDRYPFRGVHERVAAMCASFGIRTVDLLPAFKGEDGPRLWIHPRDRHPNPQGHQIIERGLITPITALVNARLSEREPR
jgi:lysophospholipase L1-like esterase